MADSVTTVGAGGDYTTLDAWETATDIDMDLDGVDNHIARIIGSTDLDSVEVFGATNVSASAHREIRAQVGNEYEVTGSTGASIQDSEFLRVVGEDFVEFHNLRISSDFTTNGYAFYLELTTSSKMNACLVEKDSTRGGGAQGCFNPTSTVFDFFGTNIIISADDDSASYPFRTSGGGTQIFRHCSLSGWRDGGVAGGWRDNADSATMFNCLVFKAEYDFFDGTRHNFCCSGDVVTTYLPASNGNIIGEVIADNLEDGTMGVTEGRDLRLIDGAPAEVGSNYGVVPFDFDGFQHGSENGNEKMGAYDSLPGALAAIELAGATKGVGVASGSLVAFLSGTAKGAARPSGDIPSLLLELVATTRGVGKPSGFLKIIVPLSGIAAGVGKPSGDILREMFISGTTRGVANPSAFVIRVQELSGISRGFGVGSGELTVGTALLGSARGRGVASGNLELVRDIAGSTKGVGTSSGDLEIFVNVLLISGKTAGVGAPSGALDLDHPLSATTRGTARLSGDILREFFISGKTRGVGKPSADVFIEPEQVEYFSRRARDHVNAYSVPVTSSTSHMLHGQLFMPSNMKIQHTGFLSVVVKDMQVSALSISFPALGAGVLMDVGNQNDPAAYIPGVDVSSPGIAMMNVGVLAAQPQDEDQIIQVTFSGGTLLTGGIIRLVGTAVLQRQLEV